MQIKVNGKEHTLQGEISVKELIEQLSLGSIQIAVERNREIIPRSNWENVQLDDADEIEIVKFIGGG